MTDTTRDLHPMTNQIPIEQAQELVQFKQDPLGTWYVVNVKSDVFGNVGNVYGNVEGNVKGNLEGNLEGNIEGNVWGNVEGHVFGNVEGDVCGNVWGNVKGNVWGNVGGTIKGRKWQFVETPKEKLKRLIQEDADKDQLLEAFNQLEESDD